MICGWRFKEETHNNNEHDTTIWKRVFEQTSPFAPKWDSIALECPNTGALIHWISVHPTTSLSPLPSSQHQQVLGIIESNTLDESKTTLAENIQSLWRYFPIMLRSTLGDALRASDLLGRRKSTLLGFDESTARPDSVHRFSTNSLKEIALPTDSSSLPGMALMKELRISQLKRPVAGLYQYSSGLCIRPLPTAAEDLRLSPPSFVFHCDSVQSCSERLSDDASFQQREIGHTGAKAGQLVIRHPDFLGIDVRLCDRTSYSSMFAEAQESLMAASLPELQSGRVLHGGRKMIDSQAAGADCWVEFRANVKNPHGFFSKPSNDIRANTKAPKLPFE